MSALSSLAILAVFSVPGEDARSAPATTDTVLLQFASPQCPHCRAMEPVLTQLSESGCRVQVVDVSQQRDLAGQFRVTGIPTFVALAGGQETGRVVGAANYERLVELWKTADRSQGTGDRGQGTGVRSQEAGNSVDNSAVQAAMAASVRLRVEDASGFGYGTGTVIDTHDGEALVVTCGHLFRDSQGKGRITADVFASGASQTMDAQLIAFDLDRDIALVSVRVPGGVKPVEVAPPGHGVRTGDRAFTVGCDKGADPSLRQTQITAVNKYLGKPNYSATGQPVDGRSGGGLFTADGLLIGICNAADPADNEGLYAGLAAIHWQLDQIGQSHVYQRAARQSATLASAVPPLPTESPSLPHLPSQMPASSVVSADLSTHHVAADRGSQIGADELSPAVADGDAEIVFIVRSKRNPQKQSEVFVVDRASLDLIARITHAARTSGEQRAALAQARTAGAAASRSPAHQPPNSPPVVRGQSADY